MVLRIWHGVYEFLSNKIYNLAGYFHEETREPASFYVNDTLKQYLIDKSKKFFDKYDTKQILFTLGHDIGNNIGSISVCHPKFESMFDIERGESIVIGRIKRMRGDLQKRIYEHEEFIKKIKLYDKIVKNENGKILKDENGKTVTKPIYKEMICRRVKKDINGNPIVIREIYYRPYNLTDRWIIRKKNGDLARHKNGERVIGNLKYPFISVVKYKNKT